VIIDTPNTALDKKVDRILNLLPKEEESKVIKKKVKPVKNVEEEKEEKA